MKKFFERYPAAVAAVASLLAIFFGYIAYASFEMFHLYCPEEILDEHLATFALPVGILFLYLFVRCVSSAGKIIADLIKEKFHLQHNRH